jgi:prophage DNA circulation protein
MTDVLQTLPPFSWRGKIYPVLERRVSFAHDNAAHKIQYLNGAFVDMTGAQNLTFSYTLALREDIAISRYEDLFSTGLVPLLNDCLLRTPGTLVDPVYGQFRCVPARFDESTDNNKRDGADVQVEFQRTLELDEAITVTQPDGLQGLAGNAYDMDAEIGKVDWKQVPSPGPTTDIFGLVSGVLGQIAAQRDRVSAILEDLAFRMEKVDKAADDLEDPRTWPLKRAARRTQAAALQLKDHVDPNNKRVQSIVKGYALTLTSFAAQTGMTVQDLLKLNPALAKSPMVRANTPVFVYQRAA